MTPTVKADLREIWQAATRAAAEATVDTFTKKFGAKYEKGCDLPDQGPQRLLAFYGFPTDPYEVIQSVTFTNGVPRRTPTTAPLDQSA